jgi:beta-mannanase
MYGCSDNLKGCLSVSAYRLGGRLNVSISKTNVDMDITTNRAIDSINVSARILNDNIKVFVKPIGSRVIITCSLVCTIAQSREMWLWDNGKKLLWDNKELIYIDYGNNN